MTHWRTARLTSGGQPSAGPRHSADTRAGSNSSCRELAALSFGVLSALAPALIVAILLFVYYALIA